MIKKSDKTSTNVVILFLAIAVMVVLILVTLPTSLTSAGDVTLSRAGQTALAVLVFALIMWMTEAIPFHITGLISMLLLAVLRIDSFKEIVKQGFGNDIIIFFIGVLVLSAFITKSGLGKRLSVFILSKTGNKTHFIILGFLIAGVLVSMWVTDMAVAAMLLPLAKGILEEEKLQPLKSNFGKALMIACAWGPIIGGIGTPAGTGANPLAIGFLRDIAGINVSFIDWMKYGVPAALLLILPAWGLLMLFFKPEQKTLAKTRQDLIAEYRALPKMEREEKVTVVIFLLTIVLWITSPLLEQLTGFSIPISMPVLFTSCLFFFPKVSGIKWKVIEESVSWSGIILVVSGISLGMMLYTSGAATWLSIVLLGRLAALAPFIQVFAVILVVSLLKIVFSSNTVTATIIIPIIITLAQSLGLNPLGITLPAAITSSMAFILVTSTPTNVIPYSAGYFTIKDMAKAGVVMTVVSSVIVAAAIYLIGIATKLY